MQMMGVWLVMPPLAGVMSAFNESNFAGKLIVIILLAGSVLAWTVMLTKLREVRGALRTSRKFLTAYRRQADPLAVFLRQERIEPSPILRVYLAGCQALLPTARPGASLLTGGATYTRDDVTAARSAAERMMADEAWQLENSMGLLATMVTAGPSLGLLGTVWGVMDSFGSMAHTGAAMLSAVAPGVSGALLTTVVGLVIAIPSAIGYNMIAEDLRRMDLELENFVEEYASDLTRAIPSH